MTKDEELFERYKLMIQARNFHYENFNKWMTYFYVAIGALFVGYCTIVSSEKIDHVKQSHLELIIPIVGYIVSLLWFWSSKGYYYWNIHFITMINHYEKDLLKLKKNNRVYFGFANKAVENEYVNPLKGANISTSKVTIFFAFIVACLWGFLFLSNYIAYELESLNISLIILLFASIGITLSLSFVPKLFLKSNIDYMPNLKIKFDIQKD